MALQLHPIVTSVSLVRVIKDGTTIGSATGFFYLCKGNLFLVTNNHVVGPQGKGDIPDGLRLRLHTNQPGYPSADYDVYLYENGRPLWKVHPRYANADVALLRLNREQITRDFFIWHWQEGNFLPPRYRLDPGEDVFVMGYPHGVHDRYHNLPILRNALVASPYGVPFERFPIFLTDANLHPGTSGSPVITKPKSVWTTVEGGTEILGGATVYYLLGIHSGGYRPPGLPENLGLGVAWYAQLIEDTAASF